MRKQRTPAEASPRAVVRGAIVVSVAVHAAVLAWSAMSHVPHEPARGLTPRDLHAPSTELSASEDQNETLSIEIVPLDLLAAPSSPIASTPSPHVRTRARIEVTAIETSSATSASGETSRPTRHGDKLAPSPPTTTLPSESGPRWLGMRSAGQTEDLLAPPSCLGCPPASVQQYYGGPPSLGIDPFTPLPELEKPSPWQARKGGKLERRDAPFTTTIERDGTIRFEDKPNVQAGIGKSGIGGSFDATDAVMKALGMELYPHRKLAIMEETRALREDLARKARTEALQHAIQTMGRRLTKLWRRPDLTLARRKELLFLLWDECAENGPEEVVAAGDTVRAQIESFVRENLPEGSADSYATNELVQLNARRASRQPFSPYDWPRR